MTYLCPVCGYRELPRPPQDDLICSCCGTQFGYHDYATEYDDLRRRWLAGGAHWFSHSLMPPPGWNPLIQLAEAGMLASLAASNSKEENQTDAQPNGIFSWGTAAAYA